MRTKILLPFVLFGIAATASADQSITLHTGDSSVRALKGPDDAPFASAFTATDFSNASSGVLPTIISPPIGPWTLTQLAGDTTSQWIGVPATGFGDPGLAGASALYAFPFTITESAIQSVTMSVNWGADNGLGAAPNPEGAYVNGTAVSGVTGGGFTSESSASGIDITNLVATGSNTVYLYGSDSGGPAGILARIQVDVVTARADIEISKVSEPTTVTAGNAFNYRLNVTNHGPDSAFGIQIVDTLPAGVTYNGFSGANWSCSLAGSTVTCDYAVTLANASTTSDLVLNVSAPNALTVLSNSATASTQSIDNNGNNDSDTADTTVTATADIEMSKVSEPANVGRGDDFIYRLNVTNDGPDSAFDVQIVDTLPAGITYNGFSGANWSCSLAALVLTCDYAVPLANNDTTSDLVLNVTAPNADVTLSNSATASTQSIDNDGASASAVTRIFSMESIPTLSAWGLGILAALIALLGLRNRRQS